jgi:hypothetical protein
MSSEEESKESEFLKPKTYRDTISTVTLDGKRKWVYALMPKGKFYNWRSKLAAHISNSIFRDAIYQNRRASLILMINIIESKFVLFSKPFWPQDFYIFRLWYDYLPHIHRILFTVIYGRLFCGWICPSDYIYGVCI